MLELADLLGSPQTPARENELSVKRGSATFAAAQDLDSDCECRALQDVAETNIFVADGPREAHSVRFARTFAAHARSLPISFSSRTCYAYPAT